MEKLSHFFLEDVRNEYKKIFENILIFDAHTHIGIDKDGEKLTAKQLIRFMDNSQINKSIIFPLDDPYDKTFSKPNKVVFNSYKRYPNKFVPFFRLNPHSKWENEFNKCLKLGFRGIKLHPRSQKFDILDNKVTKIYEKAEENDLPVLIHTGFGTEEENIAKKLERITNFFPKLKLILGHGAFVDLDETIKRLGKKENIIFELSTIRILDLFNLIQKIDTKKLVFGSDIPYYNPDLSLHVTIEASILANKKPKEIQKILGENIVRWLSD